MLHITTGNMLFTRLIHVDDPLGNKNSSRTPQKKANKTKTVVQPQPLQQMLSGETRLPYWHLCNEIPKNPTDVESDKAKQGIKTTNNNPWPRACVRPHGSLNFHSHSIGTEVPLPHQAGTIWEEACGRVRTVTIKQQWRGALLWMVKEAKWETWSFAPTGNSVKYPLSTIGAVSKQQQQQWKQKI